MTQPIVIPPGRRLERFIASPWAILTILAAAAVLRGWGLADWSLWKDEENTIFFSQHPHKPFPSFFPLFFLILHGLYQVTGVSVAAGRLLSAAFGLGSIALVYVLARRWLSRPVALVAALLLTVNLGHLYWCQCVRYFTLLLLLELLSIHWFLEGFERGRYGYLLLSNIAFALALLTHFSALMLMPVYVAYLFFMKVGRQSGGAYNLRGYLIFGVPHGAILGLMASQFLRFHGVLKGMDDKSMQDPLRLLVGVAAYFGVPTIALGLLAPLVSANVPRRMALFFTTAGVLPVAELVVIARLNLSNVMWYYVFIALGGFAVAAAISLVSLYQRGYRWAAALGGALVVLYSAPLLGGYYTSMHGDRERWKEACAYLQLETNIRAGAPAEAQVFATAPDVVAFYLGVPPGETMTSTLVGSVEEGPPKGGPCQVDQWFLVDSLRLTPELDSWLRRSCSLRATFAAATGPRDRSIRVYHRAARRAETSPDRETVGTAGPSPSPAGRD